MFRFVFCAFQKGAHRRPSRLPAIGGRSLVVGVESAHSVGTTQSRRASICGLRRFIFGNPAALGRLFYFCLCVGCTDSLFGTEERLCALPEKLVSIFSATAIQMSSLT